MTHAAGDAAPVVLVTPGDDEAESLEDAESVSALVPNF